MGTIKEEALAYEPQQIKNIAELKEVDVNLVLETREGVNKETSEPFKYKVAIIDGEDYRIAGKILGDLKAILEKKPNLKKFAVTKKGSGLSTQYTVIPLD